MEDVVEIREPLREPITASDLVDFMENEINPEIKDEKFYYTIVAPKSFRSNSDFTLNLTVHDAKCDLDEAIVVRVSIEDEDNVNGFKIHQDVTMKLNETEIVTISIGDISIDHNYKLIVKGISGVILEREASLDLQTQTHTILIQTDKAIYKPNDCIKYRVLVLDCELKAAAINNSELSICFTDPCRNVIKKWNGVNTVEGVFSGEIQLSDLPNLGEWKITAVVGDQVKIAIIEVAEYVLPKFEAVIESNDHFTLEHENVVAVIRAKYTHGKSLRGTAVVSIYEEDNFGYFRYRRDSHANKHENNVLATKTVIIDGHETVEFHMKNDLKLDHSERNQYFDVKNFKIKAVVTETLTGLSQIAEKTFKVHKDSYDISTDLINGNIKRDSTVDISISVRRQNGSAISFIDPQKKKITVIREQFYADIDESSVQETVHDLDENGEIFTTLNIAKNESSFSLKVKYLNQESDLGMFYTTPNTVADKISLKAKVLTEKCSINKEIKIEVMSHYMHQTYTYVIVGRGKILETKTLTPTFDENESSEYIHQFTFTPTFDYAPSAKLIVYCIRDRSIVSTNVRIDLQDDFKNFIELDVAPNTAKPGDIVELNVKSNPNSYIGLLGIDKSVLILRGGNDLAHDEIWNELELFHSAVKRRIYGHDGHFKRKLQPYVNVWEDFSDAGLITFSNAMEPIRVLHCYKMMACDMMSRGSCFSEPEAVIKPTIRKDFPETWIWESIQDNNFKGSTTLKKKVPDSLTTWVLTGFSIDPVNGLALTKRPSELCVQQPFHVSINLPYSVKRGEIVTVPCSIFNYLPNDIDAEVILENEHNEFEFVDTAIDEKIYPEIMKQQCRKKKLTIRSEDALNALFTIRPIKVGLISLKVSALSTTASDCLIKTLNVECEGISKFVNKAVYVDLREKSPIDPVNLTIEIPKLAVPDSTRIEVTCVGDLLGGTIKNLEQLIRLPYGCGEQNMLNFVPNIVVLNYLKNTHQLTAEIESRAKKFMEIGYQRELSYKHEDGSFSAFGEHDKNGSTWLTAFVARSFRQASEHITIQDHIIDEALKWLSESQTSDGSFHERGSICHKEMQSGSSNGVALTAYVLTAFLVNMNTNNEYEDTIQKALKSIVKSIENCSDIYALAVSAYALQLANHESKMVAINRLLEQAKSNDNHKWWDKSIELGECCFRESKTLNVEITAYALLTLQMNAQNSECLPILKWLLNQRNSKGGFEGTQDTIVGIEALANFATKIATKNNNVKIDINTVNDTKYRFDVNKDNALVLQSQMISSDVQSITVNASGTGFALLELGYRYNIDIPDSEAAFSLKPIVNLINEDHMNLQITTAYLPPKGKDLIKQSNMAVIEIALPSGFVVNPELLNTLRSSSSLIKRIETKNTDTVAVLYFDHLDSNPVTINIDGFREHLVDEQKPASILIHDYYDNALSAREFYALPSNDLKEKSA